MGKKNYNPNNNRNGNQNNYQNNNQNNNQNNGQWQSQNSGRSNQNQQNRGRVSKDNNRGGGGQANGRGRGGRGRGGQGRGGQGRSSGNFSVDPQALVPWINNTQNYKREELDELSVKGLQESTATGNVGGGLPTLVTFLERKSAIDGEPAKIIKSRVEGDLVIISVRPQDTSKILRINKWTFCSATLSIELLPNSPSLMNSVSMQNSEESGTAVSKELLLGNIYQRRYNAENKFLDLSELDKDPDLVSVGLFDPDSRGMKLFPALMKICDDLYPTAASKQAGIVSVSLAKNHLTDISRVATLAQHCPSLRNLDLSQNRLTGLADLEGWRWAFRNLDHLMLSDNPIQSSESEHNIELQRWFPSLTILNNVLLDSLEEVPEEPSMDDVNKPSAKRILPISIQQPVFRDEESIAKRFLQDFFPTFDGDRKGDRNSLVNEVYDERSTFSLSINTSAPRVPEIVGQKPRNWALYIRKFRNVMRVSEQLATTPRLFKGTESIRHIFSTLPATRHPDVLTESHKWWSESIPIPGLSDPAVRPVNGGGGLLIMVHGEFLDVDGPNSNQHTSTLSFDRTFLLGPSKANGGIRIACDVLMLRSYGGKATWPVAQEVSIPPGFAVEAPDKSDVRLEMEKTVLQFSMKTGLTLEFSDLCLCKNDWSVPQAAMAFEQARSTLPPHVWNPC